jgi:P4 family phage/plasmid primase-like protien
MFINTPSGRLRIGEILVNAYVAVPPSIHPDTGKPYLNVGSASYIDTNRDELFEMLPEFLDSDVDSFLSSLEALVLGSDVTIDRITAKESPGRNNTLKAFVAAHLDRFSINDVVDMVIDYDLKMHGNGALFLDKSEFSGNAYANAIKFVAGIAASVSSQKKMRNESVKLGEGKLEGREYPSRLTGFHVVTENGSHPDYRGMADYLRFEHGLVCSEAGVYVFNGRFHERIADLDLKKIVGDLLLNRYSPAKTAQFVDAARTFSSRKEAELSTFSGLLNVANGILNVQSGVLLPHSKDRFFKYSLATVYDPEAKCPRWLEFLDFIFQGNKDLSLAVAEMFGYCLEGGYPWLHKAFFLYGDGRNGKSTLLDTLKALVGPANYCSVPLGNLDKPFSVIMADGKLLNAVSEGESRDLSSEAFKASCSGDELVAAHKGKPEFSMPWTARHVISLNNLPNFRDTSAGNTERFYPIPFNRFIRDEERDPNIRAALFGELSGILNWSLDGLKRLKERQRLPQVDVQKEVMEEYRMNSDTAYEWLVEHIKEVAQPEWVRPSDHYQHYASWVREQGRHAVHKKSFTKAILRELRTRRIVAREVAEEVAEERRIHGKTEVLVNFTIIKNPLFF